MTDIKGLADNDLRSRALIATGQLRGLGVLPSHLSLDDYLETVQRMEKFLAGEDA